MKYVGLVIAIALIFAFALPAYAETQSVKVSGDLTFYAVHRSEFDLNNNRERSYTTPTVGYTGMGTDDFAISIAEVQVDADLTDNVSTCIRIANQRNWGDDYKTIRDGLAPGVSYTAFGHGLLDLGVDLAYVNIKELFFKPVSLKIGRQDIWFGRGMIIGVNQVDPGHIESTSVGHVGARDGIGSPELTAFNSFDAVRATIDFEQYAPFVVDLVYMKDLQGTLSSNGVDTIGINAGYTFNVYNAEAEAYYWYKSDRDDGNPYWASHDTVNTMGARGSFMPTEEWLFGGEAAIQTGQNMRDLVPGVATGDSTAARTRLAGMLNGFVDYLGWQKYMYSPKVGAEVIYTSGDDQERGALGDTYTQWNPMYRGYFPLMIRPFLGAYYMTSRFPLGEDVGLTNQYELILRGSLKPLDDILIEANIAKYYFAETPLRLAEADNTGVSYAHDIGSELDIKTTYDYTEDVTFSLLTAWFWPGEAYDMPENRTQVPGGAGVDLAKPDFATEVIASCKVSF